MSSFLSIADPIAARRLFLARSGLVLSGAAVALLAGLHPLATIAASTFFGALITGAGELQRSANISSQMATLGQAVVILALILFGERRER